MKLNFFLAACLQQIRKGLCKLGFHWPHVRGGQPITAQALYAPHVYCRSCFRVLKKHDYSPFSDPVQMELDQL